MDELVCYCLDYTTSDIKKDFLDNAGRSTIVERIMAEKKAGNCQCTTKNPKAR